MNKEGFELIHRMKKAPRRALAIALAVALTIGAMVVPTVAAAEDTPAGTDSIITGFEALSKDVVSQTVAFGTPQEELTLPETLTVTVMTGSTPAIVPDSGDASESEEETETPNLEGTPSEATPSESEPVEEPSEDVVDTVSAELSVTWTSEPDYDPEIENTYRFTPTLPEGYALAEGVSLPEIAVTVGIAVSAKLTMGLMSTAQIDYVDENGNERSETATEITGPAVLTSGWYYVTGTHIFDESIAITGDVKIILADDCDLTARGGTGILVPLGSSLTIYSQSNGTGRLTASGSGGGAGIGGGNYDGHFSWDGSFHAPSENLNAAGSVTINGGIITATGGTIGERDGAPIYSDGWGAGIGGGSYGSGGTVTINGGTVTATGGFNNTGIGAGRGCEWGDTTVTINGGSVKASNGMSEQPKNSDGDNMYLCKVEYQSGMEWVEVNGTNWNVPSLHAGDGMLYLYLSHTDGQTEQYDILQKTASATYAFLASWNGSDFTAVATGVSGYGEGDVVPYVESDGTSKEVLATVLTSEMTTLYPGWYYAEGNLTINKTLAIAGNVKIILTDGCHLTVTSNNANNAGIHVPLDSSLTIYGQSGGTGRLTAVGQYWGAGIGSGLSGAVGSITINGGKVNATGGVGNNDGGAGIGGGALGGTGGNITINGGEVTATGKSKSAGIGGKSDCNITINGGIVNASGTIDFGVALGGAGIGGSQQSQDNITITITGGIIIANGGTQSAAIGGGMYGSVGNITITGGTVTAEGWPQDIGGGYEGQSGAIVIEGGSVKAVGGAFSVPPQNSDGQNVYLATLENQNDVQSVSVDNRSSDINANHSGDSRLYLYMTGADHEVDVMKSSATRYNATWNEGSSTFTFDGGTPQSGEESLEETAVTLALSQNDFIYGSYDSITATATVNDTSASSIMSGFSMFSMAVLDYVSFYADEAEEPFATVPVMDGEASVTLDISGWNVGGYDIKAVYSGSFEGKSSEDTIMLNILKRTPTVADLACVIPTGRVFNGTPQGVFVTPKAAALGAVTVYYDGSVTTPADAGTYTITADIAESTNNDSATGLALGNYTISPKSNALFTIEAISPQTYTGSAITPEPEVSDGIQTLIKDVDFTYGYSDNIDAGASATVNITGIGNYAGSTGYATFIISPKPVTITPDAGQGKTYGESDPTLTYSSSESGLSFTGALGRAAGENAGTYPISLGTLSAGSNYDLSLFGTANFTIGKADNTLSISCSNITYGETPGPSVQTNTSGGAVSYEYKIQGADDGTYTLIVPTAAGNHTVRGTSAATANYNAATDTANFTIARANNTLSISCSNITYGETPSPSILTNTGGGTVSYEYKVQGADESTYTSTAPIAAGSYTVRGTSAATQNYNAATDTADFSIGKATPILQFDALPGVLADGDATLTATLGTAGSGDAPTGSVTFKNGGETLGTANLSDGVVTFTWHNVPAGTHSLSAEYAGDANYEGVTGTIGSFNVSKRTQTALAITGLPSTIVYGDGSFALDTSGGSGSGGVTFTVESDDCVSVSGNAVTVLGAGNAVLKAIKAADSIYNEASATIGVTVGQAAPDIELTATTGVQAGGTVTLTATLEAVGNGSSPTGTVSFKNGGEALGTANLTNGTATFTWSSAPAGSHSLTAEYSGNRDYVSVSAACTLVVANAPSPGGNSIGGITPGSTLLTGNRITFTVTGAGMDNLSPNEGDVRYVPASWSVNPSGTWTEPPYTATFTISRAGNYTLRVVFNREVYTSSAWVADGTTDTQSVSFEIAESDDVPQTGDNTVPLWPFVAGGATALGAAIWIALKLRKKRA